MRRSRTPGYEAPHRYQLLTGYDFLGTAYGNGDDFDHETALAHWQERRQKLLTYWTQNPTVWQAESQLRGFDRFSNPEPGGPGTRPWAWWYFEAPEPRRRIGGRGEPLLGAPADYWGHPSRYASYDVNDPPTWEPERDYLTRLKLLDKVLDGAA